MLPFHFERALFVVGEPNAGKSTQLRSMFQDWRLGSKGVIPTNNNLPEIYRLSNERSLYLRLTSAHEVGETPKEFLDRTWDKIVSNTPKEGRRWNFASALQPAPANNMKVTLEAICRRFESWFEPERIRVVFLSPDRHGNELQGSHAAMVPGLLTVPKVEVCWIDARDRRANGLLLADYFDFT
jgi:hypothetical protein